MECSLSIFRTSYNIAYMNIYLLPLLLNCDAPMLQLKLFFKIHYTPVVIVHLVGLLQCSKHPSLGSCREQFSEEEPPYRELFAVHGFCVLVSKQVNEIMYLYFKPLKY